MSVEENKALVRRFQDIGWSDWKAFPEWVSEDYVNHGGTEGRWHATGLSEEMGQNYRAFGEQHPTAAVVIDDIIGGGDKVAIRWTGMDEGRPVATGMSFNSAIQPSVPTFVQRWSPQVSRANGATTEVAMAPSLRSFRAAATGV
jgi:hypothetical protein